eukprot:c19362_g1_i3.p2 GENE.c19362_g1_i3~~c19362_g1_i3.p2  ORF type:complete len:100 (-),score=21.86 c19362_g1_i3:169-468(-)
MESLSSFIPENDPVKGQWFRVDPPQIATAMGIPNPAAVPFFERVRGQDAPNEPFAKSSSQYAEFTLMPTGHAGYAATWCVEKFETSIKFDSLTCLSHCP